MTSDQTPPPATIPPDDPSRGLTVARPDQDQSLPHVGLVGDTYTILVGGADTAGQYTLIDMHVPPGGGPPSHRHDFEEMFTVLEGEVKVTFRGETLTAHAGETINVPANAPHAFTNASGSPLRLLCLCAPAGQDEFFTLVGQPVASRTEPPPPLDPAAQAEFIAKSQSLAPRYRTELLPPPGAELERCPHLAELAATITSRPGPCVAGRRVQTSGGTHELCFRPRGRCRPRGALRQRRSRCRAAAGR